MPRFAILEHIGAPDDPAGRHHDLLLEAGDACRTWRLAEMPVADGPPVTAIELPPHRLAWLDHEAGEVSGGRGFARRIAAGAYEPTPSGSRAAPPAVTIDVMLESDRAISRLVLTDHSDHWIARLL
jgi:hypothetical protein